MANEQISNSILSNIEQKLDIIQRLITLLIKGTSTDSDMVRLLVKAKFKPAEVARLLGLSTNDVTSRISADKKEQTRKPSRQKAKSNKASL